MILGLLASLGLAALRSGVAKSLTDQIEAGGHDEAATFSEGAKPTARFRVGANG